MSGWEKELVDPFLAEVLAEVNAEEDEAGSAQVLSAQVLSAQVLSAQVLVESLAAAVQPAELPAGLREELLVDAAAPGRYARFLSVAAAILDLPDEQVRELLDKIDDPESWSDGPNPDLKLYDLPKGPKNQNAITGFVRMPASSSFPEHSHLGAETVLVIQGSYVDTVSGAIYRPGEIAEMPTGSSHGFLVRPGPDLTYLVVAQDGITIGDNKIGPDDVRL